MKYTIGPVLLSLALSLGLPGTTLAQTGHTHSDHMAGGGMDHGDGEAVAPTEPGQSAFAAIAEIVDILRADPTPTGKLPILKLCANI